MLLSCTYVIDFCFGYFLRHFIKNDSLLIVPALSFAILFDGTDVSLSNAHLFDVRPEPTRNILTLALNSVVALQLSIKFDIAELLLT